MENTTVYLKRTVTKCKLTNGAIVEYDACSEKRHAYDPKVFRYIGRGVCYEINGVKQKFTKLEYFFVKAA